MMRAIERVNWAAATVATDTDNTDFIFGGFTPDTLDAIVDPI